MHIDGEVKKDGYMVRSMRMISTNEALTDITQIDEATPIRELWSGRYRGTCVVITY